MILIVVLTFLFAVVSFLLSTYKDEIWNIIRKEEE